MEKINKIRQKFFDIKSIELKKHIKNSSTEVFCGVMMLCGILFLLCNILSNNQFLKDFLFFNTEDTQMDFFNCIHDFYKRTPYTDGPSSYPPLAILLFYLLGKMLGNDVALLDGFTLRTTQSAVEAFYLIFILCAILIYLLMQNHVIGNKWTRKIFGAVSLVTTGMLYTYDRGNIIILALVFLLFFVNFRNSDNKIVAEITLISLAISASLKIYPAIFWLLLIYEKEYKKALRVIIYGGLIFLLPFWAFEGAAAIPIFVKALLGFSSRGVANTDLLGINLVGICKALFLVFDIQNTRILTWIQLGGCVLAIAGCFLCRYSKNKWKQMALFALLIMLVPGSSAEYAIIFMLIPLQAFFSEKEKGRYAVLYAILFILLLAPIPWAHSIALERLGNGHITLAHFVWQLSILFFFLILMFDFCVDFFGKYIKIVKGVLGVGCIVIVIEGMLLTAQNRIGFLASTEEHVDFDGTGTLQDPYLIQNADELERFSELVNEGNEFRGKYFKQTADIDLGSISNWQPIGLFDSEHYFWGTYNGNGYSIANLNIDSNENVALFGVLGGKVMNLELRSGMISGACVGSIASHAASGKAVILNCVNYADVDGDRAGGIADNFAGSIINCVNYGTTSGDETGRIVSYSAGKMENCYAYPNKNKTENTNANEDCIDLVPDSEQSKEALNEWISNAVFNEQMNRGEMIFWDVDSEGKLFLNRELDQGKIIKVNLVKYVIIGIITGCLLLGMVGCIKLMLRKESEDV